MSAKEGFSILFCCSILISGKTREDNFSKIAKFQNFKIFYKLIDATTQQTVEVVVLKKFNITATKTYDHMIG
jgi:hypothetical protein